MIKRSSLQIEKENFLHKKKTADQRWDDLIDKVNKGIKIEYYVIAQAMNECNWADYALLQKNLLNKENE